MILPRLATCIIWKLEDLGNNVYLVVALPTEKKDVHTSPFIWSSSSSLPVANIFFACTFGIFVSSVNRVTTCIHICIKDFAAFVFGCTPSPLFTKCHSSKTKLRDSVHFYPIDNISYVIIEVMGFMGYNNSWWVWELILNENQIAGMNYTDPSFCILFMLHAPAVQKWGSRLWLHIRISRLAYFFYIVFNMACVIGFILFDHVRLSWWAVILLCSSGFSSHS